MTPTVGTAVRSRPAWVDVVAHNLGVSLVCRPCEGLRPGACLIHVVLPARVGDVLTHVERFNQSHEGCGAEVVA